MHVSCIMCIFGPMVMLKAMLVAIGGSVLEMELVWYGDVALNDLAQGCNALSTDGQEPSPCDWRKLCHVGSLLFLV